MSRKLSYDRYLFGGAMLLVVIGLVMIYSSSAMIAVHKTGSQNPYYFLARQCVALLFGGALMFALMHVDLRMLRDRRVLFVLLAGLFTALVLVLFQPPINGTRRWFLLGAWQFQPAELAKPVLILFLASQLAQKEERIDELTPTLLPILAVLTIPIGLILMQPDFGTAFTITLVAATLFLVAGISWRRLFVFSLLLIPAGAAILLSADYRRERLLSFLNPEADPLGSGFQAMQSLIAIGTGGLTGLGIGNGRQKLFFLPEPHTDFIFAIIGEELGFLGAAALLGLFAFVVWRGLRMAWVTDDRFIRYAAVGFAAMIGLQALINTSVALSLMPTKGLPLPLVSYGGSSLVTNMIGLGVLLNVSQHVE